MILECDLLEETEALNRLTSMDISHVGDAVVLSLHWNVLVGEKTDISHPFADFNVLHG